MNYGYVKNISIFTILLFISSCSPHDRLSRLLNKHPYLLDSFRVYEVQVKSTKEIDTQFFWKTERDTITFRDYRLERFRDTIKFFANSRNCTTNIYRTEIRPTKPQPKLQQTKKGQSWSIYKIMFFILLGFVLSQLIKKDGIHIQ